MFLLDEVAYIKGPKDPVAIGDAVNKSRMR